jgi:RNA polymerase sigma-70 factor (ECF subfamily)
LDEGGPLGERKRAGSKFGNDLDLAQVSKRTEFMAMDEETLVGLAKNGSNEAFEELVRLRQSWLRNFLRRLTNDPFLADDLSQQVFFSAWKGIRDLRSNSAFHAWLKRLAVNTWLKHVRRNQPLDSIDVSPEGGVDQLTHVKAEPIAEAIDLDRALVALTTDARLCVVLSYGEGMSHGMIAELTKLPLGTVKSHISRGAQVLRKILAIYGDER